MNSLEGVAAFSSDVVDHASVPGLSERRATRCDVLVCYETILNRDPENETVIIEHLAGNPSVFELMSNFINSEEHRFLISRTRQSLAISKTFGHKYLAKSFSEDSNHIAFLENHLFLSKRLGLLSYKQLIIGDLTLYEFEEFGNTYSASIQFARDVVYEGELTVSFAQNAVPLYVFSFSIITGEAVKLQDNRVILISRMQGVTGRRDEIKAATKSMNDVAPQYVIFYCIVGIANALGIKHILGTSAAEQLSFSVENKKIFQKTYDAFFETFDASILHDGLYVLEVPLAHKPLEKVTASHRARTKKRRHFKDSISRATEAAWRSTLATMQIGDP